MRRKKAIKRPISPDPLYKSVEISKFINYVMERGKKSVARKIVYDAFEIIKTKTQKDPLEVFNLALANASPLVEVKSRRMGGANYQVPVPVKGERKMALSVRWILNAARNQKGKPMRQKLAEELINASQNTGSAIKKKEDTHRMADANKAFAHFAW